MNWIAVKHYSLDKDLSSLSRYLSERGLVHRISEENGQQCLAVVDAAVLPALQDFLQQLDTGQASLPDYSSAVVDHAVVNGSSVLHASPSLLEQALHTPIAVCLIALSALGALVIGTDIGQVFWHYLSFQDFTNNAFIPLNESLMRGELWRLLTPIFLHFGIFHFLFNSLWVWDLGRRVELLQGRWQFVAFVVATGVASNVVQYLWSSSANFGGMSGVVYALVGFIAVRQRLVPHPLINVPPALIGFMLFWLVLCMTGMVDFFISGSVANAAHLGGLVAGALYALATRHFFVCPIIR